MTLGGVMRKVLVMAAAMLPAMVCLSEPLEPAKQIAAEIAAGKHPGLESFIMRVDGETVARTVAPSLTKQLPDLRATTKSITALLIGIAIDQGKIPSVKTKVMDLLPARKEMFAASPSRAVMTLEDLLTMRSGVECNDWEPSSAGQEDKMYSQRDWVGYWSQLPMRGEPGREFSYCTGNVIALGEILEHATGLSADAFALKYLFIPLEFSRAEWQFWNHKQGVDTAGHLRLLPDDLIKIGDLLLAGGKYRNKRIVSEQWIEAMTHEQTRIPGMSQRYGYLWWIDNTKDPNLPGTRLWWAQGNGGTLLVVMPELKSVVAVTGTRFNRPDSVEPMYWLRDRLLPVMKPS